MRTRNCASTAAKSSSLNWIPWIDASSKHDLRVLPTCKDVAANDNFRHFQFSRDVSLNLNLLFRAFQLWTVSLGDVREHANHHWANGHLLSSLLPIWGCSRPEHSSLCWHFTHHSHWIPIVKIKTRTFHWILEVRHVLFHTFSPEKSTLGDKPIHIDVPWEIVPWLYPSPISFCITVVSGLAPL